MSSRVVSVLLLACALATQASVSAQDRFVVEGRVVAEDTGKPLPGTSIMQTQERTSTRADAEGRFEIAVPAAQPTFFVAKPGYVRTLTRVSKSQRNVVVRMPRGGVLIVHVFDAAGAPRSTTVRAAGGKGGRSMSVSLGTDDRGQVRIANLIEGRYTVSAGGSTSVQVRLPPRELSDAEVIRLREEIITRRSRSTKIDAAATVEVRAGRETAIHLVDVPPPGAPSTIDLSGSPEAKGTAAVEGRVVDANGGPVPGARVTLIRGLPIRGALSDASGAFTIDNLPAGAARVTVSKTGFSMVESDPTASGLSVSLKEGERREGIVLRMAPGSEITGTVLDEYGEPVERAMVQLVRMGVSPDGSVRPVGAGGGSSDDRGRYRIPRVAPGPYALLTLGEVSNQGQTYLFYPGVVSLEAAHMLEVPEGRDVTGIDFRLNPDLGQRLSGTVVDFTGRPFSSGGVELTGTDARGVPIRRGPINLTSSGAFEFLNVAPGRYTVSVRSFPASPVPPVVNGRVARPPSTPESGMVEIQVGDTPPARVVIRTAPGTPAQPR